MNKKIFKSDNKEYTVCDDGNIYDSEGNLIKPAETNYGHLFIPIRINGKSKTKTIHKLVFETFVGKIPEGMVIHHIDENKHNNSLSNLRMMDEVEHRRLHAKKYFYEDKEMICPVCGEKFLWTAEQQKQFDRNHSRKDKKYTNTSPLCSRRCAGIYSSKKQIEDNLNDIDLKPVTVNGEKYDSKKLYLTVMSKSTKKIEFEKICYADLSEFLQKKYNLHKYRANDAINKNIKGTRKRYKDYIITIYKQPSVNDCYDANSSMSG